MDRLQDYDKTLPINEIYTAMQSEGSRAGTPTIVVRTTGCTHRCFFHNGGWCDTWYSSIHPEKGKYTFRDIITAYDENAHIKEMMLTGGSPTMHGKLVNELTHFAHQRGIKITIETEGSHFLETDYPIDLISLSPKFSNSIPKEGIKTPKGKVVDEKFIKIHNRKRLNHDTIIKTLKYHKDYHYKPVWVDDEQVLKEIEAFRMLHNIPKEKTYLMPGGDTRETLIKTYGPVMEKALEMGYKFTGRAHIIAYDTQREV